MVSYFEIAAKVPCPMLACMNRQSEVNRVLKARIIDVVTRIAMLKSSIPR